MIDFTAHQHPVMAVTCPDCGARAGTWCVRPSEHKAANFHASRREWADRVFIREHGERASIERTADGWAIDPEGRAKAYPEQFNEQKELAL
ncbi:zinc finger domain-containing protein [Halofilum ochraceum]|uniref:zinc finger domain-containing protein n=1 Tax=Halofilum ochraceum TaxID=1611323 RepID=UPI0008D9E03D|nr:hypothetical protein [Halofilum ochraceum]